MGVPGLFSSLVKANPEIIKKTIENNESNNTSLPNHFYLDFNCAIYCAFNNNSSIKTEESLIIYTVEYLETLCKTISNLELIYIALDGVPVFGKCVQQRNRRFHSICRKNRSTKINETFGSETDKSSVNNNIDLNCITPGTPFMYDLSLAIRKAIAQSPIFKNKTVIFSDSSVPKEGEHKLMHHIREAKHLAIDGNEKERLLYGTEHNTVIYGMDADLLFLSLILHLPNVYLFREAPEFGKFAVRNESDKFLFMDITVLSDTIIEDFKFYNPTLDIDKKDRYIDDYAFLGMLLGNDFMPKNHWYSIHEGGYERFISAYFQNHNHSEKFLVDRQSLQINTEMLCDIWYIIKNQEQEAIVKLFEKRKKARPYITAEMTERERQQTLSDFYPLQHLYVEQEIAPAKPNWKPRYYKICFNMEYSPSNIQMATQAYLKTLVWNFLYYFDEAPSWDWYYPFDYAPTFADIYDELLKHKNINMTSSNKVFHFKPSSPIDQQALLFMVLPFASRFLIVKDAAHKLSDPKCPMNIYFPKRYGLNVAFHRYYHECTPVIYKMEIEKVKKFMKECKFTEDELRRNLEGKLFIRE